MKSFILIVLLSVNSWAVNSCFLFDGIPGKEAAREKAQCLEQASEDRHTQDKLDAQLQRIESEDAQASANDSLAEQINHGQMLNINLNDDGNR